MPKKITKISSFKLAKTSAADTNVPSTLYADAISPSTADWDFMDSGTVTESNEAEIIFSATAAENSTFDVYIYGANDGGPQLRICKLSCIVGDKAVASGSSIRWVDTVAETNYHISSGGIQVADSGANTVCKVGFDLVGYRYLNFYVNNRSGATNVYVYMRTI